MIISRTPIRMSFVGGGSDLPSFYRKFGGAVVSTAIDRYVYVTVNPKFDNAIRIGYSQTEIVESVNQIQHNLVREALKFLEIDGGIEITSMADIPSRGTGLGSSSAFAVGLLNVLYAYKREFSSADKLATGACELELSRCKEPIGKQDQYASAFGGLNFLQFNEDDSVFVNPIVCYQDTIQRLQENLLVLYTGKSRSASDLLRYQNEVIGSDTTKQETLRTMVKHAYSLKQALEKNQLDGFGEVLHENWLLKKSLTEHVSTHEIDGWYDTARRAGAIGGKLLGAGAGGFLALYAPRERHDDIASRLPNLRKLNFKFTREGSKIVFIG